ncbi:MAG: LysM peptidoglycan-binding domain-containing protein [Elusimicrobia bacterium]|nr:LysM peptidoglycan-binding domain-containing protein [Elusimicrobiota bacterium]
MTTRARRIALAALVLCGAGVFVAADDGSSTSFQSVTVRAGDTLWGIANTYLKEPTRWNELVKYNRQLGSDPTVALPGMVLRVPVKLIKEDLRAALLIFLANRVLSRRKDSADWVDAHAKMQLYKDDGLQTLEDSRARVRFIGGEVLSMEPNSMAILRPRARAKEGADLELLRGGISASRAKTITVSAIITPKTSDTRYVADLRDDLSTRVEVYAGKAEVEGSGTKIEVSAGYQTEVGLNSIPSVPNKIPDMSKLAARIAQSGLLVRPSDLRAAAPDAGKAPGILKPGTAPSASLGDRAQFNKDLKSLSIGVPITAYHIQASRSKEFDKILVDKTMDIDEDIDLDRMGLAAGRYWLRVATVDLLGAEGRFGSPRTYQVGSGGDVQSLLAGSGDNSGLSVYMPPEAGERVRTPRYRVRGRAASGMTVRVNGKDIDVDDQGSFESDLVLKEGPNRIRILATNVRGNQTDITRIVTFEP